MNFDINQFSELGYVIVKDFLSKDELDTLLETSQKHYEYSLSLTEHEGNYRLNSPTNLNKIEGACEYEPEFLKIAKNKILVDTAKQLINTEEIEVTTHFFCQIPNTEKTEEFYAPKTT